MSKEQQTLAIPDISMNFKKLEVEAVDEQRLALRERGNKYRIMIFVLKELSPHFPGLELGYYGGRDVDDVVDGDKPLPKGFETVDSWIDDLAGHIDTMGTSKQKIITEPNTAFVFQQAINYLQPLENEGKGDSVKRECIGFLEAMRLEYHRRIGQTVLTGEEILQGYWQGFGHAQNITLIALKSKIRIPPDCPPVDKLLQMPVNELPLVLPIILGKTYAIKDLEADLERGICNIPKSVLEESGLTLSMLMRNPSKALNNQTIKNWAEGELNVSRQLARKLRLKKLDMPAKLMVGFLTAR